jgi:hypothetical protein
MDRVVTVHTENEFYSLLLPLSPHWHQNKSIEACGRVDSDRKQSKEEYKWMNIDGDVALLGGVKRQHWPLCMQKWIEPPLAPLAPHWHPNQHTKGCSRADSDRKIVKRIAQKKEYWWRYGTFGELNIQRWPLCMQKRIVPPLAPLAPHWHPNQHTKGRSRADSDRKIVKRIAQTEEYWWRYGTFGELNRQHWPLCMQKRIVPPLVPLASHWHPNQHTKGHDRADSNRKQSKE